MKLREQSKRIIALVLVALMLSTYLPNIFGGILSVNAAPEDTMVPDEPDSDATTEEDDSYTGLFIDPSSQEVTGNPTPKDDALYDPTNPFGATSTDASTAPRSDINNGSLDDGLLSATSTDAEETPAYHITQDSAKPAFEKYKNLAEWTARKAFKAPERTYSFEVCTAAKAGDTVLYFAVKYKDTEGVSRTHFLFPHLDGFDRSNALLEYYADDKSSYYTPYGMKLAADLNYGVPGKEYAGTDYSINESQDYIDANGNVVSGSTSTKKSWAERYNDLKNGAINVIKTMTGQNTTTKNVDTSIKSNPNVLREWTVQDFAFQTEAEIKTVEEIDIYLAGGTYNCTGISIYKVDEYKGLEEYGMISGQQFFDFKGTLIADTVKKSSAALNGGGMDTVIFIGGMYDSGKFTLNDRSADDKQIVKNFVGEDSLYSFRVDLADTVDGGIESFINADATPINGDTGIVEDIALEIQYKDIHGWNRKVVLPFVLNSYAQARSALVDKVIFGYAQRGDTIACQGFFPELATFVSDVKVIVGAEARNAIVSAGGLTENGATSKMNNSLSNTVSDHISISGMSLYKGGCMPYTLDGTDPDGNRVSGATIYYAFENEGSPIWYYTTTKADGRKIMSGGNDTVKLSTYTGGPLIAAGTDTDQFLVTVKTSDIEGAGSDSDISMRFGYKDIEGSNNNTAIYRIKEAANQYMGKWPTIDNGNFVDASGLVTGGTTSFLIEADGLMDFTGLEVDVGDDSWTVRNITIAYLESYQKRAAFYTFVESAGATSNFWLQRENISVDIFSLKGTVSVITDEEGNKVDNTGQKKKEMRYKTNERNEILEDEKGNPILEEVPEDERQDNGVVINSDITFKPSSSYRISFDTDTTDVDVRTTKYSEVRYSMTWEQTQVNWGFFKKRKTYDIAVKVAEDSDHDTGNGDSGSSNHFYFQLIFKNGNSAYVLANQQITSDGFRAGYTENFTISTNQNYGELKGVRIIPEQNSDDSEPFDKLNIEKITISEENNGGCYTSYIVNDVGWIEIDYHDELESVKPGGQKARTANELSKIYKIADKQKNVKLVCEIAAEPWSGDYDQFIGSMKAEILYTKESTGLQEPITVDVVQCMANYMKTNVKSLETDPDPDKQIIKEAGLGTLSDQNYMFRPNHTDRLLLPAIPDLRSIDSITFTGQNLGKYAGAWCVKNISVLQVVEDGAVQLTTNGELYRNISYRRVCTSTNAETVEKHWTIGGKNSLGPIEFTSNRIIWNDEDDWATPVSRLPDSTDDKINMFIYPQVGSKNENGASVNATLKYNIPFSQYKTLSQKDLTLTKDASGRDMYMVKDLNAPDFLSALDFTVYCKSSMIFDYAIIQHVREGTIISNYCYNFIGASAERGATGFAETTGKYLDSTDEHFAIGLGAGTKEKILSAEKIDMAVSFDYKSSLDGATYQSPYVYLTDQGYTKTEEGLSAELDFDVPFVKEITAYHIAGYGSLEANVSGAAAVTYEVQKEMNQVTAQMEVKGRKRRSYASFNDAFAITDKVQNPKRTSESAFGENSVAVFEMKITTLESTAMKDTGTKASVRMKFHYNDYKGVEKPDVEYEDITQYIQGSAKESTESSQDQTIEEREKKNRSAKQFFSGETQSVKVYLNDLNENKIIKSLDILPYNNNIEIKDEDAQVADDVDDKSTEKTLAEATGDGKEADTSTKKKDNLANKIIDSRNESWTIKDFYGYYMGYDEEVDDIIKKPGVNKTFDGLDNGGTLTLMNVTLRTTFKKNNESEQTVKDNLATIYAEKGDKISGSVIARAGNKPSDFEIKASLMIGDAPKDVTKETIKLSDKFYFTFTTPRNTSNDVVVYKLEISVKDAPEYVDTILVNVPNSDAIKLTTTIAKNEEQPIKVEYGMEQIWADEGDTIFGSVVIESEKKLGFTVNASLVSDKETDVSKDTLKKTDDYHFEFKVPKTSEGKTRTYKIKVAAVEDPELYDTIVVSITGKEKEVGLTVNVAKNSEDFNELTKDLTRMSVAEKDTITGYVSVKNSDKGYNVNVTQTYKDKSGSGQTNDLSSSVSISGEKFTFKVPALGADYSDVEYEVKISAVDDSSKTKTLILIPGEIKAEAEAAPTPTPTPKPATIKTSIALNNEKGSNVSDGLMTLSAVVGDSINGSVIVKNSTAGYDVKAEMSININTNSRAAEALGITNEPEDISAYITKYNESFVVTMPPFQGVDEFTTAQVKITVSPVDDPSVQDIIIVQLSQNSSDFIPQTAPIDNPG